MAGGGLSGMDGGLSGIDGGLAGAAGSATNAVSARSGPAPSASIVIPARDATNLNAILHRIRGQGQPAAEVVVLDGGTGDGLRETCSQFPEVRYVPARIGPGPKAWNEGMRLSTGDPVVFLAQDAVPADGDWISHLTAPFEDPAIGAVYGRQRTDGVRDPLGAFRLGRRFPEEPHWRRARFGDPVTLATLRFSIANAAIRRSVWKGIRFNERLTVGADQEWARQVLLASFTVAYVPDAVVSRILDRSVRGAFQRGILHGWTAGVLDPAAGSFHPAPRQETRAETWHLLRTMNVKALPYLALESAAHRYGYLLGHRLHRMSPGIRGRIQPELAEERPNPQLTEREKAA